jgi:hypothetical protein
MSTPFLEEAGFTLPLAFEVTTQKMIEIFGHVSTGSKAVCARVEMIVCRKAMWRRGQQSERWLVIAADEVWIKYFGPLSGELRRRWEGL